MDAHAAEVPTLSGEVHATSAQRLPPATRALVMQHRARHPDQRTGAPLRGPASMFTLWSQRRMARATNSGPLSDRRWRGAQVGPLPGVNRLPWSPNQNQRLLSPM
jgi:hypothetical protein